MDIKALPELLAKSAKLHSHLCPRQVLGVRMGLAAGERLKINLPQTNKQLYTIAETDGCATDGISVATNCWVGRRNLRIEDFGKVAATFINSLTGQAIRLVPRRECRQHAFQYAAEGSSRWQAQLMGYQSMPLDELFCIQQVKVIRPLEDWISKPNKKAICDCCDEEIINRREICQNGMVLCQACAGGAYYHHLINDPFPVQTEAPFQEVDER